MRVRLLWVYLVHVLHPLRVCDKPLWKNALVCRRGLPLRDNDEGGRPLWSRLLYPSLLARGELKLDYM